jgi:hypothetical protein
MLVQNCWSRGLKRRPLLQTSSPLKSQINRGLTLGLLQQMGHFSSTQRAMFAAR